jgi:hypothetical protein
LLHSKVQEHSFSGWDNENPYHLCEFEQVCSCLKISGMAHETLKWKLFPFSLIDPARQWYTSNIRSVNRDWSNLRDRFCLAFFHSPISAPYEQQSWPSVRKKTNLSVQLGPDCPF